MAEAHLYSNTRLEEVHLGTRITGFVENGRLMLPAFRDKAITQYRVEGRPRKARHVDGRVKQDVFDLPSDGQITVKDLLRKSVRK